VINGIEGVNKVIFEGGREMTKDPGIIFDVD